MWKFHWFYSENYEAAWLHISSENLLIQNPFSKSLHQALVEFRKGPQRKYWKFCKWFPPFCLCYNRAMCPNFASPLITRDGGETKLQRNSWKGILLIKKRLKSLQEFTPILFACYDMAICPNFESPLFMRDGATIIVVASQTAENFLNFCLVSLPARRRKC